MSQPKRVQTPQQERENAALDRAFGRWGAWVGPSGVVTSFILGGVCGYMIAAIVGVVVSWGFGLDLGGFPFFSGWYDLVLFIAVGLGAVLGGLHSIRTITKQELERMDRETLPKVCACGYSLEGNTTGVCPECGQAVGATVEPKSAPHSEHTP